MGKRRKRKRKSPRPDPPRGPINVSRILQVLGNLTFRRQPVLQDLVFSGIEVDAATPEELAEKTEQALVERTRGEPEN